GVRARAEDGDAEMAELVRNAGDEGRLGAYDDEVGLQRAGQSEQALRVLGAHGMAVPERRDARIPGSRVQLVEAACLAELPGECVLASAGTDQQHLHTA